MLEDNNIQAVLFINSQEEEEHSGVDWEIVIKHLLKSDIQICKKLTIEDDNIDELF